MPAASSLVARRRRSLLLGGAAALLGGCAARHARHGHHVHDHHLGHDHHSQPHDHHSHGGDAHGHESEWHEVRLPGKATTAYRWEHKGGRRAVAAHASASASMWRRRVQSPPQQLGQASFSWWVDELIAGASVAHAEREDAPARVLFGFGGDPSRLSMRNRLMFDLAEALTGEAPPFATLMYVWENEAPVGSVIVNPRTDRIRKIVLDSGPSELGRWRDHVRDLGRDFRQAFGEGPGPLVSVAVMTDADNTRSTARAWYGPVRLL